MNTNNIKKSYILFIWYPRKDVVFPPDGYKALKTPASLFAAAFARNHTAINKEANFNGASLFTNERPIGDRLNSPHAAAESPVIAIQY